MFGRILEALDLQADVTDIGADAGPMFGPAQVGLVASKSRHVAAEEDTDDDPRLLLVALFVSDQDNDEGGRAYPENGPWEGEIQAVDFTKLMSALSNALPNRHEFLYNCHLSASADEAQLEFAVPIRLWHAKRPFGSLVGARFTLEERGARDGWVALDTSEGEVEASLHFVRSMRLDAGTVEKAWTFIRRIYDNVFVLGAPMGDGSQ